jgi:hypothetical protein
MNLETYLKQATRGIWGKRKTDAILELRGNIEARIWTLEHQGKTQAEALEIALSELGDARAVNAGMTQVHTMPNVTRNILLAGLISSVAAVGWTSSTAQIQTVVPNIQGVCCQMMPGIQQPQFVRMNDLKVQLERAGVTVDESMQRFEPSAEIGMAMGGWPLANAAETRTLDLHFPEMVEGETVRVQALLGLSVTADGQNPQFIADEDVFIEPDSLTDQLRMSKLPMTLEGWYNPTLRIGQTAITIGTRESPVTAATWYSNIATEGVFKEGFSERGPSNIAFTWNQQLVGVTTLGKYIYSMRVNDRPGTVYGLFMSETNPNQYLTTGSTQSSRDWIGYTLARVNDQGVLQFVDGSSKVIEFVKSFKGITNDLEFLKANRFAADRLNKLGYGSAKRPAKAMLVRLTGRLDMDTTEIVVPAKPRLMASPR